MRIRSMLFGCIAVLAAAICFSTPSMAMNTGATVLSISVADYDLDVPVLFKFDGVEAHLPATHARSTNFHTVVYTLQNQPHSLFRQNVEAYSRIDPHI